MSGSIGYRTYFTYVQQLRHRHKSGMTEELEALSHSDPGAFNMEHVWTLIRAVKVQGQVLQMYLGRPALDG